MYRCENCAYSKFNYNRNMKVLTKVYDDKDEIYSFMERCEEEK